MARDQASIFREAVEKVDRAMTAAGESPQRIREAQHALKLIGQLPYSTYSNADLLAAAIRYALARRDHRDEELTPKKLAEEHGVHVPSVGRVAEQLSDYLGLQPLTFDAFFARLHGLCGDDQQGPVTVTLPMPRNPQEMMRAWELARHCRAFPAFLGPLHERSKFTGDPRKVVYQLRVKLAWKRTIWRDLELRGDQTLEELHFAIQSAFHWDNDHLWCFYMTTPKAGKRSRDRGTIYGPMELEDDMPAEEAQLADFELRTGRKFTYLFDFGDQLWHELEVRAVGKPEPKVEYPRLVQEHGEAPEQYPDS